MTSPAQLDRDIAESLAGRSSKQPLYGHTNEATAYLVDDYPYGGLRTQIRYWLEGPKPKKGWRFVSQTKNPKTGRWNKPKASTYIEWGAAMFLDDKGHVQWTGIGPYSDDKAILAFVETFPEASMTELKKIVPAKLKYLRAMINGDIVWTINKVPQPLSEVDVARLQGEMATWEQIAQIIAGR